MHINEITFPSPQEAVVKGVFRLSFKNERPTFESAFRAELIKADGQWKFTTIRQINLEGVSTQYDHLKELSWLIGDWIDQDQDVTIALHNAWSMQQNFIVQRFVMYVYDTQVLEGEQVIGWDPIQKEIRSWIFDSDGGFGEGKWFKQNGSYRVKMSYALGDGSKASAVHIYTPINAESYTFSSESRDINGMIQPNIAPIKFSELMGEKS